MKFNRKTFAATGSALAIVALVTACGGSGQVGQSNDVGASPRRTTRSSP